MGRDIVPPPVVGEASFLLSSASRSAGGSIRAFSKDQGDFLNLVNGGKSAKMSSFFAYLQIIVYID